jgi:hypothetical protein
MIPIQYLYSNRLIVLATISGVSILVLSLFSYDILHGQSPAAEFTRSSSPNSAAVTSPGEVSLAGAPASASSSAAADTDPIPNINIASDGLVLLNDAQVVSISGSTLDVRVDFGGMSFPWVVQTNSSTKFPIAGGNFQSLSDIRSGDVVTVTGTLSGAGSKPALNATFVRE